ncbi:hypothetical protein [Miltoncostaea marina]|uniref:hypothetical protein n=1 Tax=Miltoncostaea marina TaxID=2843215 RepID=UPI001C3CE2B2|nr:hypothetical protein [Miltoncostaea marina]
MADDPTKDPRERERELPPTDPAPSAAGDDDPMDHRFAADEEAADGTAGADEARTPGMPG